MKECSNYDYLLQVCERLESVCTDLKERIVHEAEAEYQDVMEKGYMRLAKVINVMRQNLVYNGLEKHSN